MVAVVTDYAELIRNMAQWMSSYNSIEISRDRSTSLSLQWLDCCQVTPRQLHSRKIQVHAM